jgi:hypothetical protein
MIATAEKLLINHAQAAQLLGISGPTLTRMRMAGQVPFVRIGDGRKGIKYSVAALTRWVAKHGTTQRPAVVKRRALAKA